MVRFNRAILVKEVTDVLEIPQTRKNGSKKAEIIVQAVLDSMIGALRRGEKVQIAGFGTFYVGKGRKYRFQPLYRHFKYRSKEFMTIPAHPVVKFRPAQALKRLVNQMETE